MAAATAYGTMTVVVVAAVAAVAVVAVVAAVVEMTITAAVEATSV